MRSGSTVRRRPLRLHLLFVTLLSSVSTALATPATAQGENGYLRGKGGLVVAIDRSTATFEEEVTTGNFLDVDRTTHSVYVDYGLRDDLDLIVQPLIKRARPEDLTQGLGEEELTDLNLGLKWRAWKRDVGRGELHFLLAPGIQTPLRNYETEGTFALGSGHTDYKARGIAHYHLRTGEFWASVEAGYDFRSSEPPDVLVIRAQLGFNLGLAVLQPYYDLFDARGGEDDPTAGAVEASGVDYDQYGLKLFVPLERRLGLTLSSYRLDDGRATGSIEGFSIGLVYSG